MGGLAMIDENVHCDEQPTPESDGEARETLDGAESEEAPASNWGALLPPLDGEAVYRVRAGYAEPVLTSVVALGDGRMVDEDAFVVRLGMSHFRDCCEARVALVEATRKAIQDANVLIERLQRRLDLLLDAGP